MAQIKQNTAKKEKGEIDWQAVYTRIAAARDKLETAGTVSEQERERIWKERAIQAARKPKEDAADSIVHLAIVNMGRELCAFEVSNIESIRLVEEITRVPRSPQWVAGVANLRGHIYSVTDLQKFLHLNNGQTDNTGKGEIIMIKTQKIRLALRVDSVRSVEMIQETRIHPSSDTIHGVKPEFIRGVIEDYAIGDGEKVPILVLNLDTLLTDESLIVHEEFV
jgi:purine-binding chemotaxis protein CheW